MKNKKNKFFIGMVGKKGSGKTTTMNIFVDILRKNSIHSFGLNFADTLKQIISLLFNVSFDILYSDDNVKKSNYVDVYWENFWSLLPKYHDKKGKMSVRDILQVLGTDIFRTMDSDIWVKNALLNSINYEEHVIIFGDCRFPNEIDMILKNGGCIIKLLRNVCEYDKHKSEIALDSFDWTQKNIFLLEGGNSIDNYKLITRTLIYDKIIPLIKEKSL